MSMTTDSEAGQIFRSTREKLLFRMWGPQICGALVGPTVSEQRTY